MRIESSETASGRKMRQEIEPAPVTTGASPVKKPAGAPMFEASGAEVGCTLLALLSFAAALYALWLASVAAGLTPRWDTAESELAVVDSGRFGVAWGPVALACLAAVGLIWFCFWMLSKSSHLATNRRLLALTQDLTVPDAVKLKVILAASGIEFQRLTTGFSAPSQEDEAIRAAAAGNWVLERFREGLTVVAVPESLADAESLQSAFGAFTDRPIQVLRHDLAARKDQGVP